MRRVRGRQVDMFAANDPDVLLHAAEHLGERPRVDPGKLAIAEGLCREFNEKHPVGSTVTFRRRGTRVDFQVSVSRAARVDVAGHAVVQLTGVAGLVPIGDVS